MQFLRSILFERSRPFWQFCLLAFPVALIPSIVLLGCIHLLLAAAGANMALLDSPEREASMAVFLGSVFFASVVETFLLGGLLGLLGRLSTNKPFIATISGLLWGALHAASGVLLFFGTAWSFFVFSCVFQSWRVVSFKQAFVVALVPHMLINVTVIGILAMARN